MRIVHHVSLILLGFASGLTCNPHAVSAEGAGASLSSPVGPPWRPGYERPPVIDVHAHISSTALDRLGQVMDDSGLRTMTNMSGGVVGRTAERSVEASTRFGGERLVHFVNVDWRLRHREGFGAYMARALEHAVTRYGFKGLKISKALGLAVTDAQGRRLPVDWPELAPLFDKAGELGVPVSIHTGDPKAFWDPVTPDNERYAELKVHPRWSFHGPEFPSREQLLAERDRLVARHPKTTFILVHFGNNPEDLDYVDALLKRHPNAVIDTAARVPEIGRHPPDEVRDFFIRHKARILFGTDLGLTADHIMLGSSGEQEPSFDDVKPFYDAHWRFFEGNERGIAHPTPIQGDWTVDAINLPEDVLDYLYWKNAARILKLDAPTPAAPGGPGATGG
ncbi:MAG: hypothetical protein CSA66_04205 [Proteobacteria bacterium]|nr:MAG: hypothetical protein CSA66_04205 [Pseudomonadota bacterium]